MARGQERRSALVYGRAVGGLLGSGAKQQASSCTGGGQEDTCWLSYKLLFYMEGGNWLAFRGQKNTAALQGRQRVALALWTVMQ